MLRPCQQPHSRAAPSAAGAASVMALGSHPGCHDRLAGGLPCPAALCTRTRPSQAQAQCAGSARVPGALLPEWGAEPCSDTTLCAEAEEGEAEREHTVVLQYDGVCQTQAFAQLADQASTVTRASSGALGLGIVSILGFEDSFRNLQARAPTHAPCQTAERCWLAASQIAGVLPARPSPSCSLHAPGSRPATCGPLACRRRAWPWTRWTGWSATAGPTSGTTSGTAPARRPAGTPTRPGRSTSTSGGLPPCACAHACTHCVRARLRTARRAVAGRAWRSISSPSAVHPSRPQVLVSAVGPRCARQAPGRCRQGL